MGAVAFLTLPQFLALQLYVGLRTGEIQDHYGRVSRADHPIEFWFTAAFYAALLAEYVGILVMVAIT